MQRRGYNVLKRRPGYRLRVGEIRVFYDVLDDRVEVLAVVLIGFESEDDWFEYRLENDPRFLRRIESARMSLRSGRGVALENIDKTPNSPPAATAKKRRG